MSDTEHPTPGAAVSAITGLPELPEGYYWHIRKVRATYESDYPYLQIRKLTKRKRWFDKDEYIAGQAVEMYDWIGEEKRDRRVYLKVSDYDQRVLETAYKLLEKHKKSIEKNAYTQLANAKLDQLAGSYPPKKLGA